MLRCVSFFLLLLPAISFASWQIAGSPVRTSNNHPNKRVQDFPKKLKANPHLTLRVKKGHLRENVQRYINHVSWRLYWHTHHNWPVLMKNTFTGSSVPEVTNQLISNYPLYVVYEMKSKKMRVYPYHRQHHCKKVGNACYRLSHH